MNTELKQKREERGLTQAAIAQQSGIALRAYQYIELSGRIPRADTAILIADALKVKSYKEFKTLFGAATPAIEKEPGGNRAEPTTKE